MPTVKVEFTDERDIEVGLRAMEMSRLLREESEYGEIRLVISKGHLVGSHRTVSIHYPDRKDFG